MDEFEEFRKKQAAKKAAEKAGAEDQKKAEEAAKKMGWIDGLGPAGVTNPKVKGFVLGRFKRKKINPKDLPPKPEGFESTTLNDKQGPGTTRKPTSEEELKKLQRPKNLERY